MYAKIGVKIYRAFRERKPFDDVLAAFGPTSMTDKNVTQRPYLLPLPYTAFCIMLATRLGYSGSPEVVM